MQEQQQKNRIKAVIIILAVLFVVSVTALAGMLIYKKLKTSQPASAVVSDNTITPDKDSSQNSDQDSSASKSSDVQSNTNASNVGVPSESTIKRDFAKITLDSKNVNANVPFTVGNMFPGDSEVKTFQVKVSYSDNVTVHYHADVRSGYEKLAEVLKAQVLLKNTNEVLYDGLMSDMPKSLSHKLSSKKGTVEQLDYAVTVYLDTSVGNEYKNLDLVADFRWWVEETGNLQPTPQTGDVMETMMWVIPSLMLGMTLLIFVFVHRRREDKK